MNPRATKNDNTPYLERSIGTTLVLVSPVSQLLQISLPVFWIFFSSSFWLRAHCLIYENDWLQNFLTHCQPSSSSSFQLCLIGNYVTRLLSEIWHHVIAIQEKFKDSLHVSLNPLHFFCDVRIDVPFKTLEKFMKSHSACFLYLT